MGGDDKQEFTLYVPNRESKHTAQRDGFVIFFAYLIWRTELSFQLRTQRGKCGFKFRLGGILKLIIMRGFVIVELEHTDIFQRFLAGAEQFVCKLDK